jgi:hypothetical protein
MEESSIFAAEVEKIVKFQAFIRRLSETTECIEPELLTAVDTLIDKITNTPDSDVLIAQFIGTVAEAVAPHIKLIEQVYGILKQQPGNTDVQISMLNVLSNCIREHRFRNKMLSMFANYCLNILNSHEVSMLDEAYFLLFLRFCYDVNQEVQKKANEDNTTTTTTTSTATKEEEEQ